MKRKIVLTLLVSGFLLLTIMVPPFQYQDDGSNYEPTGHHGGI
ncbi:hypothetical protein C1A50_1637 [Paenibacillus polymyxa]|nr:hypothetical protein C1A50_1637 [Paenibacillus polymyxa]